MLSMPRPSDRCMGSTARKVATTLGIADMKVNHIQMKTRTRNPGINVHFLSQLPGVAIFPSGMHWQSLYSVLLSNKVIHLKGVDKKPLEDREFQGCTLCLKKVRTTNDVTAGRPQSR